MARAEFTREGDVGEVVLADSPLNLFGLELARDVMRATEEVRDSGVRAALVRAEGENFSAGAHVEIFLDRDEQSAHAATKEMIRRTVDGGVDAADAALPQAGARVIASSDLQRGARTLLEKGPGEATFDGR